MDFKSNIIARILEYFIELNQRDRENAFGKKNKEKFSGKYWDGNNFFSVRLETAIFIGQLEDYFNQNLAVLSDDELLDMLEYLAIEIESYDCNGY